MSLPLRARYPKESRDSVGTRCKRHDAVADVTGVARIVLGQAQRCTAELPAEISHNNWRGFLTSPGRPTVYKTDLRGHNLELSIG